MRGFKQQESADILTCGHALVQNLRNSFSTLPYAVPHPLRPATAWPQRTRAL